jgi:hypothetical protein
MAELFFLTATVIAGAYIARLGVVKCLKAMEGGE